jgi:uncharacterized phage protein gp47/JayE
MSTNSIDSNGLSIQSVSDIINEILNGTSTFPGMYQIYGANINVASNSPDGQMVNIIAQAKLDVLEFLQAIYNSFDPDKATGVSLNARCAINGVVRNPGTLTQQQVQVTTSQALTLPGLDLFPTAPFTVSDGNGNQYALAVTYVFSGPLTQSLLFQAVLLGPISSLPLTITTIVTTTLGVTSVTNSAGPTTLGLTEETDYALRIRRQISVSLPSKGFLQGLLGALLNTLNVTQAAVYENNTNSTDGNGIPGHSIWCIVAGGANTDVANAIYVKRNAGCGMKGSVSVNVTQVDGSIFVVQFDRPTAQTLYISFNVASLGSGSVDPVFLRNQILAQLFYTINQQADITTIVALVRSIVPNAVVSAEGVSPDNITYSSLISPTAINNQFTLSAASIYINGVHG